jgi:predicted membrane protein
MKYFSNKFTLVYALILAVIVYLFYELTDYKNFIGNGFIFYCVFVIIGVCIVTMHVIYKLDRKRSKKSREYND